MLLSVPNESVAGAHLIYERIGYQSGVETVVDYFLANVGGDDRVNGRFSDTDMAQLRGHLIDQVCEATDGEDCGKFCGLGEAGRMSVHDAKGRSAPETTYVFGNRRLMTLGTDSKGKNMREAHAGMGITEAEFAIIAGHFAAAMEKAGVSASDHAAIMSVLSAMQDDIVGQ